MIIIASYSGKLLSWDEIVRPDQSTFAELLLPSEVFIKITLITKLLMVNTVQHKPKLGKNSQVQREA